MRVTFAVANYAPSLGGAQLLVQQVAEGLVSRHGHEVRVITTDALHNPARSDRGRVGPRSERLGNVRVDRMPVAGRTASAFRLIRRAGLMPRENTRTSVGPLGARLAMAVMAAGRRSDVVVSVTVPSALLAPARWGTAGGRAALAVVPLLHLRGEAGPPEWALDVVRRADGCVCATPHEAQWLLDHGVVADRTAVLPPGCHPERFEATEPSAARARLGVPDRPTVGYVGRLAAQKGIDQLLAAAPRIWDARPDTTILVVGSPVGWDGLDDHVSAARAVGGDRLVVREGFEDHERSDLLSACDVVAFPSREESFGMVTVEAWCARRPVVAADIPAVRSLIRPGIDGDLVPVGASTPLADAILALLDDPDRRSAYAAEGRRRAESEFNWDHIVDGWDEFLRATCDRAGVAPRIAPMSGRN